jgi:DNA-binding response OmpR family regulator
MTACGSYPRSVTRVLIVDDDPTVAEVVVSYLDRAGMEVASAADGLAAVTTAIAWDPDLVVLDLMLPGIDGLEVCRRLRAHRADLPVIMLTARGSEEDRVLGLEVGADDYVTKPFSPRELVLRVQSVLRRAQARYTEQSTGRLPEQIADGDISVDTVGHRATKRGEELSLTTREFDLLAFLLAHPGRAYSRDDLMREVWEWEYGDKSTVTVHVRRLREKIELDPSQPTRLVTVWGVGYRWDPVDAHVTPEPSTPDVAPVP